jgi:CheY-like chemotaxis protein
LAAYSENLDVLTYHLPRKAYEFFVQLEAEGIKPCLIILDMNMPGMSGAELLPILRAIPHYDDTPITVFTTSNSKLDYLFAKKYNAGFITKPIDYKQLEKVAETFLSHCTGEVREKLKS